MSGSRDFNHYQLLKVKPMDYIRVLLCVQQVSGKITYNGREMDEFVPERIAAYVSQDDLHSGELTVRERLAFSAKCQGVGDSYGNYLVHSCSI